MDETIPEIEFDEAGICNYCDLHDRLCSAFPLGEEGKKYFESLIQRIKKEGEGKKYDCIIGISGGTDSTYLLHLAKQYRLRPLAVNLDNGWHSEIAVANIHKTLNKLSIDLDTYVVDYEEMKDILVSHIKAGLPWIDGPTDIAIVSSLYRAASREGLKYIIVGNNFRTEGRQPDVWTHIDGRSLKHVQQKFGTQKLKTFPNLTASDILYFQLFRGIKMIKPLYHLEYDKKEAMKILEKEYDWQYYGGHHYENLFTKFTITYWLYEKFQIDKRKVTLSAQVRSGQIERDAALLELDRKPYDQSNLKFDIKYITDKLGISEKEFQEYWNAKNKSILDYPSYWNLYKKYFTWINRILSLAGTKPMSTFGLRKKG
jgi:N-acetyl sugar amidotransferase